MGQARIAGLHLIQSAEFRTSFISDLHMLLLLLCECTSECRVELKGKFNLVQKNFSSYMQIICSLAISPPALHYTVCACHGAGVREPFLPACSHQALM